MRTLHDRAATRKIRGMNTERPMVMSTLITIDLQNETELEYRFSQAASKIRKPGPSFTITSHKGGF
jgi:hypothetical protein